MSIREKEGGRIEAYPHLRETGEGDPIRLKQTEAIGKQPSMVHLGQLWIQRPNVLDLAGLADAKLTPGAIKSAIDRGELSPDPFVKNHGYERLEADPSIKQTDHFLWAGFLLSDELPSKRHGLAISHLLLRETAEADLPDERRFPAVNLDADCDVYFSFKAIDLSAIGADARYRYLLSVSGIVPGEMETNVGFASFPLSLPIAEAYGLE